MRIFLQILHSPRASLTMLKRPHQAQSVTTHETHDRVAEDTTRMSSPLPALLRDYDDPCKMTDAKMTLLSRH